MTSRRKQKPRPTRHEIAPAAGIAALQADIARARAALVTAEGLDRRQLIGEIDIAEWTIARLERQAGMSAIANI